MALLVQQFFMRQCFVPEHSGGDHHPCSPARRAEGGRGACNLPLAFSLIRTSVKPNFCPCFSTLPCRQSAPDVSRPAPVGTRSAAELHRTTTRSVVPTSAAERNEMLRSTWRREAGVTDQCSSHCCAIQRKILGLKRADEGWAQICHRHAGLCWAQAHQRSRAGYVYQRAQCSTVHLSKWILHLALNEELCQEWEPVRPLHQLVSHLMPTEDREGRAPMSTVPVPTSVIFRPAKVASKPLVVASSPCRIASAAAVLHFSPKVFSFPLVPVVNDRRATSVGRICLGNLCLQTDAAACFGSPCTRRLKIRAGDGCASEASKSPMHVPLPHHHHHHPTCFFV